MDGVFDGLIVSKLVGSFDGVLLGMLLGSLVGIFVGDKDFTDIRRVIIIIHLHMVISKFIRLLFA
jgi:hypothetical protein